MNKADDIVLCALNDHGATGHLLRGAYARQAYMVRVAAVAFVKAAREVAFDCGGVTTADILAAAVKLEAHCDAAWLNEQEGG